MGDRASVCWFRRTIEPALFAFKKRLVSKYDVEVKRPFSSVCQQNKKRPANTMTIRMTDTGLSEINEAATVYTDIKERVRMNILIVEDEVSLANALEHII